MTSTIERGLPADVYDTLEFSVLAYKGIGAPSVFTEWGNAESGPCCLYGHGLLASNSGRGVLTNRIARILAKAGIEPQDSDRAVYAIRQRRNKSCDYRVDWKEFTRECNIVRGDNP